MKLITRQTKANCAAKSWFLHYPNDKDGIGARLIQLGETPNPDDVDKIIGNTHWTRQPICDECGENKDIVVQVGELPDCESDTANICKDCLNSALSLCV